MLYCHLHSANPQDRNPTKKVTFMKNSAFNLESQSSRGWLDRAAKCAALLTSIQSQLSIRPTLADIGCGDQKLKQALTSIPIDFLYQGYDINPQYSEIRRFDANSEELDGDFDVIVSLGVTEYIALPTFLSSMRRHCRFFVVSHVLKAANRYSQDDLNRLGWLNHLSGEEFGEALLLAGFEVLQTCMTENRKSKIWLCR